MNAVPTEFLPSRLPSYLCPLEALVRTGILFGAVDSSWMIVHDSEHVLIAFFIL